MSAGAMARSVYAGLMERFSAVGALPGGGVTRLGFSGEEDRMHAIFLEEAGKLGFFTWTDSVGNSFASNHPAGEKGYTMIGSHLDSVVEGGPYDGVVGVAAGLAVLAELRDAGIRIPVVAAAFRCEESSNFQICTVGSGLLTRRLKREKLANAADRTGKPLLSFLEERGYREEAESVDGIRQYLELHIEQGRVLETEKKRIGAVTAIAAPRRYKVILNGVAEHSGATPMPIRKDSLCAAADIILGIRQIGLDEAGNHSVATVGSIDNRPNVINAVPGRTEMKVDLRGIDEASVSRMEHRLAECVETECKRSGIRGELRLLDARSPVTLDRELNDRICAAAGAEGLSWKRMPSGAGHDACSFAGICPTAMIFIPCREGISHNIREYTSEDQVMDGIRVLLRVLRDQQENGN